MQILTVQDASTALVKLQSDLSDTAASVALASNNTFLPGTSELASTAISLVQQLQQRAASIALELYSTSYDGTEALTAPQVAELKQLQQQVIEDRALINSSISSVDWTFGGIFADTATILENTASQAVTGLSNALGINWTLVMVAVGAIVVFFVWAKVS